MRPSPTGRAHAKRTASPHRRTAGSGAAGALDAFVPKGIKIPIGNQSLIPRIAKDPGVLQEIELALAKVPTAHELRLHDARDLSFLRDESVHLVVTSPPYWTLKEYRPSEGQLGFVRSYDEFLSELDRVWRHCLRVLVPGGRLVVVVGDVCLSRRLNKRHAVMPLHASIQERCRAIGFDNLATIFWYKIANASLEVANGSGFMGKPYEPNAVVKNDVEFLLMQRKPGGYRKPEDSARLLSVISEVNHKAWFQQIWTGVRGESTRHHPAPFPLEIAERLIRMFSFVGDTVLDPFAGTGTTNLAAALSARNSVAVEIDRHYLSLAVERLRNMTPRLTSKARVSVHD